ncbi:MAG: DNA polymerase III subunit alpha [bacterium]
MPTGVLTSTIRAMDDAATPFAHLEVHSQYTLLGATPGVEALAQRAADEGWRYLALTDYQAMYGAVAFARACRARDVQPVVGMTVDVIAPQDTMPVAARQGEGRNGRLVLLAQNAIGYRSLCRLAGWLQGGPQREERLRRGLPWEVLREHAEGLLCVEGGQAGWLYRLLQQDLRQEAARYLGYLGGLFHERAYVGLEWQGPDDDAVLHEATGLAQRFGMQPVALQPVYTLEATERPLLRLLAAVAQRCTVETARTELLPGRDRPGATVHWLSEETIRERFAPFPQALEGVGNLLSRCEPALPDGRPIWPAPPLNGKQNADDALRAQAARGLAARYPDPPSHVATRLAHELEAITGHGFAPLFLVVADIVRFAHEEGIPVSTRGSVANSLVAYCLGITTVDPVAHDLLFSRFLNPARRTPPDIDLDFCSRQRDRVLAYVREQYGEEQVALVSTMSTLQPRSALREAAHALGYTDEQLRQVAQRLPRGWTREGFGDIMSSFTGEKERQLLESAAALVGRPHHLGLHPGGIVITPGAVRDVAPVQWARKGFLATQYDHRDVEALGLPKIDLLGIRALTVLADAARLVQKQENEAFRLQEIPLQDEATGRLLAQGETVGVFQCESEGARRTLRQLQARTVRDLAVANAFFKPGPATGGMAQTFIRRYRGEEAVTLLHPSLGDILEPTQGVLLFQEQVLRVAREVAGLSWEQADQLRRGMSKMRPKVMMALRLQFVRGCRRTAPEGPGMSEAQAEQLWEQVVAFGGYAFNQGHATAYADVSYRSAYLKAHHPAAFLCARLANGGGYHHPAVYLAEARRLGLSVRPPHINHSGSRFTLRYEDSRPVLWMGLGQVRSVRRRTVAAIREAAPFDSLRALLGAVDLREKELRHLIQCGALDGLGTSRAALLSQARALLRAGNPQQMAFDFAAPQAAEAESAAQRLAWEQRVLGLPVSVHPLEMVSHAPSDTVAIRRLPQERGDAVHALGVRLPGRPGGRGFFLDDGDSYTIVKSSRRSLPPAWQPLLVQGRWVEDRWGGGWFQGEWTPL